MIIGVVLIRWQTGRMGRPPLDGRTAQQKHLEQRVRGYLSDQELDRAFIRVTNVEYHGGYVTEWEYVNGSFFIRSSGEGRRPIRESTVDLSEEQAALLHDAMNLIAKQELWNEGDHFEAAVDGGETVYTFEIAGKIGKFKVVNTDPPELELFRYKCGMLTYLLRDELKAQQAVLPEASQ